MHHDSLCVFFGHVVSQQSLHLQTLKYIIYSGRLGRIKRSLLQSVRRDSFYVSLKCNIHIENYHIKCSMNFHKPNIFSVIVTQTKKQYMSSHAVAPFVPKSSYHLSPLSRFLTAQITYCTFGLHINRMLQCIFSWLPLFAQYHACIAEYYASFYIDILIKNII